ncbi:MAG TPA: hypothetical protein VFU15_10545, partial [Bacteroidia bacterium]|nr:hypothetical protein [Bacteroidia bacterium]
QFLIPELKKKFPEYTHEVHYSFNDSTGSVSKWKGGEKSQTEQYDTNDELNRYNESGQNH